MSLELLTVSNAGAEVHRFITSIDGEGNKIERGDVIFKEPLAEQAFFDPSGTKLALATSNQMVLIFSTMTGGYQLQHKLSQNGNVKHIQFSPQGNFLMTCCRGTESNQHVAAIFSCATGEQLRTFVVTSLSRQWPPVIFSNSESLALRTLPNRFEILRGGDLTSPVGAIPADPLTSRVAFSPEKMGKVFVAVLATAGKGTMANVTIYDITKTLTIDGENPPRLLTKTQLGKAQDAVFRWNEEGSALLIEAQQEVHDSHKYYEGTSTLFFFRMPQKETDEVLCVESVPGRAGPVHDVQWSPKFNEYIASYGPMPPKVDVFSGRTGKPKLSFGEPRRNTLRWSPFGRLVLLGGFGNLPGDVDVWDKSRKEKVSSFKAHCTVECQWAPNGYHILGATTSPRLRVDNCIKLYAYTGDLKLTINFDQLFFASWRPQPDGTFTEIPLPAPGDSSAPLSPPASKSAGSANSPMAAYRPPGSSGMLAARMRAEREREQQQKATVITSTSNRPKAVASSVPGAALPPGATPKPKKKNKKKQTDTTGF